MKKKISNIFWVVIAISVPVVFIAKVWNNKSNRDLLNNKEKIKVKAVVVDERNYMGNSPVSNAFSYSYRFLVDGKEYKADSHDSNLKVGDSILVVYVKGHPEISKPLISE